MDLGCPLVIY